MNAALRPWLRDRAFAAFAVAVFAAGIGSATAVFSLVNAALLRELPFRDPERVMWMYNARTERDRAPFSIADLDDYTRAATTLEGLAPFTNWAANLTGHGDAERIEGSRVGGNFFPLLGVSPLLGRLIAPADADANARVVVLTHGFWVRRFAADPRLVGGTIVLNGAAHTVIGVLPPAFVFPFRASDVGVPLSLRDDPRRSDRGANFLRVVARLKSGITAAQAKSDLDGIAQTLRMRYPADDARKIGVNLYSLHAEIIGDYRMILWALLAAVVVLVFTACGNLGNLLLLRASQRREEFAVRLALGASRSAIVRQLSSEAAVLIAIGTVTGIVLATWMIASWRAFGPADFPALGPVALDARALAFATVVVSATVLGCALPPAWIATRRLQIDGLLTARTATPGRRAGWSRRLFVAAQMTGAAVLVVGIALFARGFARAMRIAPGFAPGAMSVQVSLPPNRYASGDAIVRFADAVSSRLRDSPDVTAAGAVSLLPLSGLLSTMDVYFPDRPVPTPDRIPQAHFRIATDGYFTAAGVAILEGREFDAHDNASSSLVAIVSRTFAARHWPGESPIGKGVQIDQAGAPVRLVIGAVDDVRQLTLDAAPTADLYLPLRQMPASQAPLLAARSYWVVRTTSAPERHASVIRAAIRAVDPDVAASSLRTLDDVVANALAPRRASVFLLGTFAQIAVLLALIGVYAVAAFAAAARRRELAIRSIFGARRRDIIMLMVRSELPWLIGGTAAGLCVAGAGARLMNNVVGADPAGPLTYLSTGAILLSLAIVTTLAAVTRTSSLSRVSDSLTVKS
jgi:predicted permease